MNKNSSDEYEDIIYLPHPMTTKPMSRLKRAAQFSAFAALSGHDAAVAETARITDSEATLDESYITELDHKLQWIHDNISDHPNATITYFVPDTRKSGGAYIIASGRVKKIDAYKNQVVFEDGTYIPICHIHEIVI